MPHGSGSALLPFRAGPLPPPGSPLHRCKQIVFEWYGTVIWIQRQERFIAGLLVDFPTSVIIEAETMNASK